MIINRDERGDRICKLKKKQTLLQNCQIEKLWAKQPINYSPNSFFMNAEMMKSQGKLKNVISQSDS